MTTNKHRPTTIRAARRTLRFETTPEGRVIVGSSWLPTRIIADTREKAEDAAMRAWAGTLPGYSL